MILRLTEGSLAPAECAEKESGACEREDDCVTLDSLEKAKRCDQRRRRSRDAGRFA